LATFHLGFVSFGQQVALQTDAEKQCTEPTVGWQTLSNATLNGYMAQVSSPLDGKNSLALLL
jgi:hypothetical protein